MNIIGILIGVAIVAGLIFAMAKMSDAGASANGCGGSCSTCGSADSCSNAISEEDIETLIEKSKKRQQENK